MASEDHKDTPEKTDDAGQDEPKREEAPAAAKKSGSKGFILLLAAAALVALFVVSRREKPAGNNTPPPPAGWAVGQTVDVELTLVATDKRDLACAHKDMVGGSKRCEFDAPKTASKTSDDKAMLRPYMTTTQQPLLAAGLWSQLPPQLPTERFTVKCKLAIEGKLSKPSVRWKDDNVFYDEAGDWMAGSVSGCAISKLPGGTLCTDIHDDRGRRLYGVRVRFACAPPPEQLIPRLRASGFRCGGAGLRSSDVLPKAGVAAGESEVFSTFS